MLPVAGGREVHTARYPCMALRSGAVALLELLAAAAPARVVAADLLVLAHVHRLDGGGRACGSRAGGERARPAPSAASITSAPADVWCS